MQPVYQRYESGDRKLPHSLILELTETPICISIDGLYTGDGEMRVGRKLDETKNGDQHQTAILVFNRLNEEFSNWDEATTEEFY